MKWEVASQVNNDYFTIYHSIDGYIWSEISIVGGAGNTNSNISYLTYHEEMSKGWNYYKLRQTDYDGMYEEFSPISLNVRGEKQKIISIVNLLGQPVNNEYKGIVIIQWDNGDIEKRLNN